jgi:hypothetical protein
MYQITAPNFVAGVIVEDGVVIQAAPILFYLVGEHIDYIQQACESWGYKLKEVG